MSVGAMVLRGSVDPTPVVADPTRLRLLRWTGLLSGPADEALVRLTRLAARTTGAVRAHVSLVEPDRQVFCASHGLDPGVDRSTPSSRSLCQHVVASGDPLVVADAREHPVLRHDQAVVQGDVVAYLGHPVHAPSGEVLGTLCVVHDRPRAWSVDDREVVADLARTAEREVELLLRRREERLHHDRMQRMADGAVHTAVVVADASGTVVHANRTAELYLGVARDELVGLRDLAHLRGRGTPAGPGRERAERVEAGKDRGGLAEAEHEPQDREVVGADGETRVVSVRHTVLRDDDGQVDGHLVLAVDVSLQRRAEEVLRDAVAKQQDAVRRLEELDRSKRDFITTASHELRTPVTSILGYTELLSDGSAGDLTPGQRAVVDKVGRNSRRLLGLVEDLLDLPRTSDGDVPVVRTAVEPAAVAARAWKALAPYLVGRGLVATTDVAEDLPVLSADAVQLERALLHLLTNAVKHTPDGGSVELAVRRGPGGTVTMEVSDTGTGIPVEEQGGLFEPFHRTREAQVRAIPGSGLGLAVVRRVVEAHAGTVALRSAPGAGTTVTLTLPGA